MIPFNEKKKKQCINARSELSAVAKFLVLSWNIEPGQAIKLVNTIFTETNKAAGAWFERFEITKVLGLCKSAREAHLENLFNAKSEKDLVTLYDTVFLQLSAMDMGLWDMEDACAGALVGGHWVYDSQVKRVVRSISTTMPFVDDAKPYDWEQYIKDYEDFGMMDEVDEAKLVGHFQGHDLSTAGSNSLPVGLSLPHVLYGHSCQGRSRQEILIGSIMSHCIGLISHNNTASMCQELEKIAEGLNNGKILSGMRFSDKLVFQHPLLVALDKGSSRDQVARDSVKKTVSSVPEYLKMARGVAQAAARVGDGEKQRRDVADKIISDIVKRSKSGAIERERFLRQQTYRELIRDSFVERQSESPSLT